jgi:hypothetical protein
MEVLLGKRMSVAKRRGLRLSEFPEIQTGVPRHPAHLSIKVGIAHPNCVVAEMFFAQRLKHLNLCHLETLPSHGNL